MKNTVITMALLIGILTNSLMFMGCTTTSSTNTGYVPLVKKNIKSAVMLAYVQRQSYIETRGAQFHFPGGMVFYFLIKPLDDNPGPLTITERQIFKIDGTDYNVWKNVMARLIYDGNGKIIAVKPYNPQITTHDDGNGELVSVNPQIITYDVKHFISEEPELAKYFLQNGFITEDSDILIQKNSICGAELPGQGLVEYQFEVGFNQELETFHFEFDLSGIR
jgi:hypothetical protein